MLIIEFAYPIFYNEIKEINTLYFNLKNEKQ